MENLPAGFIRLHKSPKKVKKTIGPVSEWDPKSRYLYKKSLERFLSDPDRKAWYDNLEKAMSCGEIGRYESFRMIESFN